MTVHEQVTAARARLLAAGIEPTEASFDAEVLAREVLGWDLARFLSSRHEEAPEGFIAQYEPVVARRERREPVAYIAGHREFWDLEFEVTRDVLVPRPETEVIVEEAVARVARPSLDDRPLVIVDVGTGSGCLAVALAREFPLARVTAIDVSAAALGVARRNAARHGVAARIEFLEGRGLSGVDDRPDLIVSNPPYVATTAMDALPPEVRYEPLVALFAGPDGLDEIRQLLADAESRLRPDGWLIFEFGYDQADAVVGQAARHPALLLVEVRADLQGIPRTAVLRRAS